MKVLWLVRGDLTKHPGGDTVQVLRTEEELRALGVDVQITMECRPDFTGYDVVHLFHLDRLWENVPHARRLRAESRPAVLSTIWWPTLEYDARGRTGLQGALSRTFGPSAYPWFKSVQRTVPGWVRSGFSGERRPPSSFESGVRELLEPVRALLPNSRAEAAAIEERFLTAGEMVVVPNAADGDYFTPGLDDSREGVLCVGRIEPRKNQLALIKALADVDVPLVFVGQAGRFAGRYLCRCRRAAPRARFLEATDRDGIRELMRRALVHVSPSWYETPGLASLEAALCGCRIVVTPGGSTREYFGDDARYASPDDPESIRVAVLAALEEPPVSKLRERIVRDFSWKAAAVKTLEGYSLALAHEATAPGTGPLPVQPR